jgi:hypothetical protein
MRNLESDPRLARWRWHWQPLSDAIWCLFKVDADYGHLISGIQFIGTKEECLEFIYDK